MARRPGTAAAGNREAADPDLRQRNPQSPQIVDPVSQTGCAEDLSMNGVVDGDSHFMEPLDLFERHIDPRLRERAVRIAEDSVTHKRAMVVDGRPMRLRDVDEVLGILSGYGQKE